MGKAEQPGLQLPRASGLKSMVKAEFRKPVLFS